MQSLQEVRAEKQALVDAAEQALSNMKRRLNLPRRRSKASCASQSV